MYGDSLHVDDHLSARVPLLEVRDGGREIAERVAPVDHGRHLARVNELADRLEIARILLGEEELETLGDDFRNVGRVEDAGERADDAAVVRPAASDQEVAALRGENPAALRERPIADVVEDEVVPLVALGEIVLRVVDDAV